MTADRVLALDVGTQSVRAMVFDPAGTLESIAKVPIEAYVPGPPGCCEQDADLYWRALGEACQRLFASPRVRRDSLAGVALTTQRGTVVVTDEHGEPLRRAMVWLDRCRAEGLPRIGGRWGLAFKAARVSDTVATFRAEAEANVLARDEPELWSRVRRFLLLSGFLTHRLTGEFVDSVAAQVGLRPVRLQAPGVGEGRRLAVARAPRPAGVAAAARTAGPAAGHDLGRRGRGDGDPRRPPAHRGRGRQGVRGARVGRARAVTSARSRSAPRRRSTRPTAGTSRSSRSCRPTRPRSRTRTASRSRSTAATG